jgi:hypothetical protein
MLLLQKRRLLRKKLLQKEKTRLEEASHNKETRN